jgi:hypothetical protein
MDAVDKAIVGQIRALGYPSDYLVSTLERCERNYATTTYFLLANQ